MTQPSIRTKLDTRFTEYRRNRRTGKDEIVKAVSACGTFAYLRQDDDTTTWSILVIAHGEQLDYAATTLRSARGLTANTNHFYLELARQAARRRPASTSA